MREGARAAVRPTPQAALERSKEQAAPQIQINPELIDRFSRTMREHFSTGLNPLPEGLPARTHRRRRGR